MNGILKGVRPLDYVLAGLMTAAGAYLMYLNMIAVVTLPILWRRRHILAVIGVTIAATALHVLAFGWITRCGVALPLSFALAYAVARFAGSRTNQLIGLAGIVVLELVVLVRDASIGEIPSGLVVALPITAVFYGIGLVVQNQLSKQSRSAAVAPVVERTAA
jgi:hypothetical protein